MPRNRRILERDLTRQEYKPRQFCKLSFRKRITIWFRFAVFAHMYIYTMPMQMHSCELENRLCKINEIDKNVKYALLNCDYIDFRSWIYRTWILPVLYIIFFLYMYILNIFICKIIHFYNYCRICINIRLNNTYILYISIKYSKCLER